MTSLVPPRRPRPMYHLLVSSDKQAWNGSPITFERSPRDRVLTFTDPDVKARFESFDPDSIAALLALPCVFAYEDTLGMAPLFGHLTHILPTERGVKLDYETVPVDPFLTAADWEKADPQEPRQDCGRSMTVMTWSPLAVSRVALTAAIAVTRPDGAVTCLGSSNLRVWERTAPGESRLSSVFYNAIRMMS